MTAAPQRTADSGSGRGDFFAVDRRAWARVCKIDINAMVAYLVLARGTGPDQRTTAWSANAIEQYTGITWPRGKAAIATLAQTGAVTIARGGRRPRYRIMAAHEIPGCEGYSPPTLSQAEKSLFDHLTAAFQGVPARGGRDWHHWEAPRTVAASLVQKGWAAPVSGALHCYRPIPYDAEAAAVPDWIWLPNALIDGAATEIAPVELCRQTQNAAALRLLVDLYHAQALASDGGIHWRSIRLGFSRHRIGERGAYVVYGFRAGTEQAWSGKPFIQPHMTGEMEPDAAVADRRRDRGWPIFWEAWNQLLRLGLVEFVGHLIEADNDTASVIHPYAVGNGEIAERRVAMAAHAAAAAMLTDGQREWAESKGLHLAPVHAHLTEVQMVGIARLRYRPRTGATAAWFARMTKWGEITNQLDDAARAARGDSFLGRENVTEFRQRAARNRYQGESRQVKGCQRYPESSTSAFPSYARPRRRGSRGMKPRRASARPIATCPATFWPTLQAAITEGRDTLKGGRRAHSAPRISTTNQQSPRLACAGSARTATSEIDGSPIDPATSVPPSPTDPLPVADQSPTGHRKPQEPATVLSASARGHQRD